MIYLVLFLLICSVGVNIYLIQRHINQQEEVKYIKNKLSSIMQHKTNEKVLLNTDDKFIKSLLIQINRLLDFNQETVANYISIEQSMRKMLSNISHDLKTPLTVILGYIELLTSDKSLSLEKKIHLLNTIHLKTEEVIDLINRFFELAKLESGEDRKSTRLNSSHVAISYAVFC